MARMASILAKSRKDSLKANGWMDDTREWIYNQNFGLAVVSIITMLIAVISLFNVVEMPNNACSFAFGAAVMLWFVVIFRYCRTRNTLVKVSTPSRNHNVFLMLKSVCQVVTLLIFTELESYIESTDMFWVCMICCWMYMHIVSMMVVFQVSTDFDISSNLLAVGFKMVFNSCEDKWEVVLLVGVVFVMNFIKNFLFGGSEAPASGTEGIGLRMEAKLARFHTKAYQSRHFLPLCAGIAFVIWWYHFSVLVLKKISINYSLHLIYSGLLWIIVYLVCDTNFRVYEPIEPEENSEKRSLVKTIGQVVTLVVFTILEDFIKAEKESIYICSFGYIHIILVMVSLRFGEDYDITGEILAVNFGMLFEGISTGWMKLVLVLVSGLVNCLRNLLISGRGRGVRGRRMD